VTLAQALDSIAPALAEIGTSITAAHAALVDAYKRLVHLIDGHEHRAAFVDDATCKLRPGVLASVCKLCPAIDKSTFSSAFNAFMRNGEAFDACTAIRQFRDVPELASDGETEQSTAPAGVDVAKVIRQFAAAVDKALSAGVSPLMLAETLKAAARKAAPAPAAEVVAAAA
jgi:hypothetical protein